MNTRKELIDLFERTLPDERRILAAMARARQESERGVPWLSWTFRVGLAGGFMACLALVGLAFTRGGPEDRSAATAEAFEVAPSPSLERQPGATPAVSPSEPSTGPKQQAQAGMSARPSAERGRPRARSRGASESVASEPGPMSGEVRAEDPSWKAVAQALRGGDKAKADALIAELGRSDSPEVRDNAHLVQLRAAVSQALERGRPLEATEQARLRTLATQGATSSIRDSARKLLREVQAH